MITMNEAKKHDLPLNMADWVHIKETFFMLSLSVVQIKVSMQEGDYSVNRLTDNFVQLVEDITQILEKLKSDVELEALTGIKSKIDNISGDIINRVNEGIVAFQFYDRLTQRLDHIAHGLEEVGKIIADDARRNDNMQWDNLQQGIRRQYTMEAERKMFDAIKSGQSVQEALSLYQQGDIADEQEGNIELF